MTGLATGAALGIAGLVACYAIAWTIARATADPRDDELGDLIALPDEARFPTHNPDGSE